MSRVRRFTALSLIAGVVVGPVAGQNLDSVQVRIVPVASGVAMLVGAGGNIAVAWGDDATFLVDDQYAPLTAKIQAAVATLTPMPVRFVLNTHWHGDHTGGNENMGGAGALIVAHDNVRVRMSTEQFNEVFNRRTPPSPDRALPVVTFTDAVTFHLNGDEMHAFHVPPAHTDGDAIVHFRRANVVHMGDIFFRDRYPFVDVASGGSFEGVIGAVERALALANAGTKIIPGHGDLAGREDLVRYHTMLVTARDRVGALIREGRSLDDVIAARPMADHDATWGSGFIRPELFLRLVYTSLRAR